MRYLLYPIYNMQDTMKKVFILTALLSIAIAGKSQIVLNLDSCRALAIANNKELLISNEKINVAHYKNKAAYTNYFPEISATAGYMRSQKELSLLSKDQKNTLSNMGSSVDGALQQVGGALGQISPDLAQQFGPIISILGDKLGDTFNSVGQSLVDALRTDTRNMYAGAITLTQPLYMGGKIRAYNKITQYAEELSRQQHNTSLQELILSTDQVYWQVVSLANKKKLAEGYLSLLQKLNNDINLMVAEGVATKADELSVMVKLNEAEMTLTKVEDGLSLCKMLLCQLCGIDITTDLTLEDEAITDIPLMSNGEPANLEAAFANRPEIKSLELAYLMHQQKVKVERAEHLPSLAFVGTYMLSNPSVFNSFENKFRGMWNVGVVLNIPIWHWREGHYKVQAAKAESRIAHLELDEAKEKIELQVNQATFKVNEAAKKLIMANKNQEKANENLRYATLGFNEGVIPTSNVLEEQTAWVSAQSEKIDAQIDVKLTEVYLQRTLGTLK